MTAIFIWIGSAVLDIGVAGFALLYLLRSRWMKEEEFDATRDLFI